MKTIDKGIPVPNFRKETWSTKMKYPWRTMEINDSFYVSDVSYHIMGINCYLAGKRSNRRFICRKDGDGIRVWRVA